jgi:hypothetical protein
VVKFLILRKIIYNFYKTIFDKDVSLLRLEEMIYVYNDNERALTS